MPGTFPVTAPAIRSRLRGCLLAGAAGDALGAPVEFLDVAQIRDAFGPAGIRDYPPGYTGAGSITDDTQMTLFTADGLIRGLVCQRRGGPLSTRAAVAQAYLRWLHTQGGTPRVDVDVSGPGAGWLIANRELHSRRAPGHTCLSALHAIRSLEDQARNDRKGCGGVMRMAPVGLFLAGRPDLASVEEALDLGVELAGITHGHPSGQLSAGVLAAIVLALARGSSLPEAITAARTCLVQREEHTETRDALDAAVRLAGSGRPHDEAIAQLGGGWVGEEALAIAVYCALVAPSLEDGIVLAVNHGGDSDSTGAIAGNLLGTLHGANAIPHRWLGQLELRDVITRLADDLLDCWTWTVGDGAEDTAAGARWRDYPGC